MLAIVVDFLMLMIAALLVGGIVYELSSGKLLTWGWKVYARRQDNPMLFWSSVALQMFVALIVVGVAVLTLMNLKN
jgi:hypothetical protein